MLEAPRFTTAPRNLIDNNFLVSWIALISLSVAIGALVMLVVRDDRLAWFLSRDVIVQFTGVALGFGVFVVTAVIRPLASKLSQPPAASLIGDSRPGSRWRHSPSLPSPHPFCCQPGAGWCGPEAAGCRGPYPTFVPSGRSDLISRSRTNDCPLATSSGECQAVTKAGRFCHPAY